MLINLLRNSIQAGPHMGPIRLAFELRERSSGSCRILVEDLGTGIPADVEPKLGTPFYTTKGDGTGLGLSICEKILTQHGGEFRLRNRERMGAIAEMILPGHKLTQIAVDAVPTLTESTASSETYSPTTSPTIPTTGVQHG